MKTEPATHTPQGKKQEHDDGRGGSEGAPIKEVLWPGTTELRVVGKLRRDGE